MLANFDFIENRSENIFLNHYNQLIPTHTSFMKSLFPILFNFNVKDENPFYYNEPNNFFLHKLTLKTRFRERYFHQKITLTSFNEEDNKVLEIHQILLKFVKIKQ